MVECTISDPAKPEQQEAGASNLQLNFSEEKVDFFEGFWALYIDGSSNASRAGAGLILINLEGVITEYALRFEFFITNNEAEYEALIAELKIAKKLGIDHLKIYSDS